MTCELAFIGAAFPRTGTMSTKRALEELGIGQIYHMHEVFRNPHHMPLWAGIPGGSIPDWDKLFAGYVGTVDFPACLFWETLATAFPNAKVLLLQRDPESWYQSMHATVYQIIRAPQWAGNPVHNGVLCIYKKCRYRHFL